MLAPAAHGWVPLSLMMLSALLAYAPKPEGVGVLHEAQVAAAHVVPALSRALLVCRELWRACGLRA